MGNKPVQKIKILSRTLCNTFGVELNKAYERCECPEEYQNRYNNDIWIICQDRERPIRCLPGEYEILS